jgi:DNA-binding MarR family transcriptional regulator
MKTGKAGEVAAELQADCLGVRVSRLQRLVLRHYAEALRPHDMTLSQMEILAALILHGDPVKPTALADFLAVERSTMSRNLALMTTLGWVQAAASSPSRRAMTVTLTPAGKDALLLARKAWAGAQATVAEALGADASAILDGWIERLH